MEIESRNSEKKRVLGTERPGGLVWLNEIREIRWKEVVVKRVVTEAGNLVFNSGLNREPMQTFQQWLSTVASLFSQDDASCMVLYPLQLRKFVKRDA